VIGIIWLPLVLQSSGQPMARLSDTPKTFYELRLKPITTGTPKQLVADAVAPALRVATRAWVIVRATSPNDIVKLTWGMSEFLRQNSRLFLVLLVSNTRAEADVLAEAKAAWGAAISESYARERLSLLREFETLGRLTVIAPQFPNDAKLSPILRGVCETGAILLLTDVNGTTVSIQHLETQLPVAGEQEIEIRWSFGDPKQIVVNLSNEIRKIETTSRSNLEITNFIQQRIAELPRLPAGWTERFLVEEEPALRLFDHQTKAIEAWELRKRRGIFQMCTGAGKTIAALAAVRRFEEECRNKKVSPPPVLVTVPTRILADQWAKETQKLGFTSILQAYNAASNWLDVLEPWLTDSNTDQPRFVVSTYRTFSDVRFRKRLVTAAQSGTRALWIADEMHNLASARLGAAMAEVQSLFTFRLGLSATPEIEGDFATTERLLSYFGFVCATYELKDGINDGVLCPYRYFPQPSYLSPQLGEKYLGLLRQIENSPTNSSSLLDLYRQSRELVRTSGVQINAFKELLPALKAGGKPLSHTLVYCPPGYGSYGGDQSDDIDTDESERRLLEEVVAYLRDEGISVSSILGDTPTVQREIRLAKFRSGELQVLCAIGCLDEGVDVPAIQRAIVLYSVDRLKQFVQRRGRILRIPRGVRDKIAEIYDIIVLPHGSTMPASQAAELLTRELRRYTEFARLSLNRDAAQQVIDQALSVATAFQPNLI
jgi:superfamily II DNA or RNA helicase